MEDFENEVTSRKTFEFEGGNKLHAERKNPYGLIYIHAERGAVPEFLKGMFTSYDEAEKAIQIYINTQEKIVTDVKVR